MPIKLFGGAKDQPAGVLEEGWQLYARPTTLEPVGTLFRIDPTGKRFLVQQVAVETQEGPEAMPRLQQRVRVHVSFFARFLGLDRYGGKAAAGAASTFEFEVFDPVRQLSTDVAMDQAMALVLPKLNYRADNRYFVIRDARSASGMTYRLTRGQLAEIGGNAKVSETIGMGGKLAGERDGLYDFPQPFKERMRVMFLADELKPVKAGLAGEAPVLGRVQVREPLDWVDGEGPGRG